MKTNIKLCVFDFDSTLMDGETIDLLAQSYGIGPKVSLITERAMAGELDFFESLTQRVALLKGMPYAQVQEVVQGLNYMPGAQETISALKERDIKVLCFSGGFRLATDEAQKHLGFHTSFANILHQKDGLLTGLVGGDMMFSASKGDMLLRMQHLLSVSPDETMVVGDGANDLSMFQYAGTRVAFCAKEILKKSATHVVDVKDLYRLYLQTAP